MGLDVQESSAMTLGKVHISISGWAYAPWRSTFYPSKLLHKKELGYAAKLFSSIEVNGTFYGLQRPEAFGLWRSETPDNFVFAIKGSRYITHMRKLRDIEAPLANFIASGILRLGPKLGPILWQFPPQKRHSMRNDFGLSSRCCRMTRRRLSIWHAATISAWTIETGCKVMLCNPSVTPSKFATKAFVRRSSLSCCASTISRWSVPTLWNGRA